VQSVGPDSRAGQRRDKGLNETLARKILELRSLGVNGGYSRQDVIALAKIISGWSLQRSNGGPQLRYAFRPELHQPGSNAARADNGHSARRSNHKVSTIAGSPSST
jgi:uncharacterized protein (DUF1800 family)